MTLKSVVRRGALATVATASAVALAACGAGQISQTANQVAAVDGARNFTDTQDRGIAVRDAQIVIDPDSGEAALKFSASTEAVATGAYYALESIEVEGAGEVEINEVTSTQGYDDALENSGADGENVIPRDCQLVADYEGAVEQYSENADVNPGCITYVSTSLDGESFVGENASASGENRDVTFTFTDQDGNEEVVELFVTISPYIPEAGSTTRSAEGQVEGAEPAEGSGSEDAGVEGTDPDATGTDSGADQVTAGIEFF